MGNLKQKDYIVTDKIEELVNAFEEERKTFQRKAQNLMRNAFTQFFNENPNIASITWTQYAPWFNDGDECVFSVHDMYAKLGEVHEERGYSAEEEEGSFSSWNDDTPEEKAFTKFAKTIGLIPDEVFQETFGNHVSVLATRDGFDVEEYEHD